MTLYTGTGYRQALYSMEDGKAKCGRSYMRQHHLRQYWHETLALDRRFLQQSVLIVLASADTCCLTEKKISRYQLLN